MASGAAALLYAPLAASGLGDTTVVAAVADRRIIVHNYVVVGTTAVAVKFKGGSTDLTGAMPFSANGGIAASGTVDNRYFRTEVGEALVINLSSAVAVGGHIAYSLEP